MKLQLKRDIYIRLDEDGTSFTYTLRFLGLATATRQVRLDEARDAAVAVRRRRTVRGQS